jgi:preprotein translocase subunit SecG
VPFAELLLWAQDTSTWGGWLAYYLPAILNVLILLIGLFMILLVLIQKGKGGGLAGAFGGAGGSSAFGSRMNDQFVQYTLITAAIWVLLIMLMAKIVQPPRQHPDAAPVVAPPAGSEETRLWHPGASSPLDRA